jgi:histidyl-tRNA synthetase
VLNAGGGSFKSQMKKEDASGARFALVIGDDEAARGVVGVKPLREQGDQLALAACELAPWLAAHARAPAA